MKRAYIYLLGCLLILLAGCAKTESGNRVEIEASQFPVKTDLQGKAVEIPEISSFGISEIKVVDSLLVVSVLDDKDFWHFYSLPKMDSIGRYFNVGNGTYEFPAPIPCFQSSFCKNEDNEAMAYIPLPDRNKMAEVNLAKLLKERNLEGCATILNIKSGKMPLWAYGLGQDRYLQGVVNPEKKSLERYVRTFSEPESDDSGNEYRDFLNSRTVESMEDIQMLLTTPAIGGNGSKVAEIPGYCNEIVVYEAAGRGGVCIEYKDMPADKVKLSQLSRQGVSLLGGGYGYDNFFTLIRNEIEDEAVVNQYLDFVSWDGKPLGSINTGMNTLRRFDIDLRNGTLYCLDGMSDEIKAFDIKSFLEDIL